MKEKELREMDIESKRAKTFEIVVNSGVMMSFRHEAILCVEVFEA